MLIVLLNYPFYFFHYYKSIDQVKVSPEEEPMSATDVYPGRTERKDSIVSDEKFDTILNSLNMLAVKIEKDFQDDNSMTDFAKERLQSKNIQNCTPAKSF